jgi:DNA-binding transcriptional LysR family regulator
MRMAILRQAPLLRQFLAVVREGSLSGAAHALALTQPALTKSIQRLEAELGVKLFERLPRGIALTKHGQALLPHAQRIDAECRIADMELQAFGAGQTGRIRIGAGEFFGATFVPRAVAALGQRYPQLGFELHSGLTEVHYPRLLAGELDLHFGTLPQVEALPDFLVATPLLKVRSRVIAGAQHPLVRKKKVTPADLARYPWAVLHHDRELIKRLFAVLDDEAGEGKVGVSVELSSLAAMVQLLQAGPYLACFAEGLPLLQPQLGLAILAYPKPIWQHQAGVVMHRSLARYAPVRELVEHVKGEAAGLGKA